MENFSIGVGFANDTEHPLEFEDTKDFITHVFGAGDDFPPIMHMSFRMTAETGERITVRFPHSDSKKPYITIER